MDTSGQVVSHASHFYFPCQVVLTNCARWYALAHARGGDRRLQQDDGIDTRF